MPARDAEATEVKLDALLHAIENADRRYIAFEEMTIRKSRCSVMSTDHIGASVAHKELHFAEDLSAGDLRTFR